MTRNECLREAELQLLDAAKNMTAIATQLNETTNRRTVTIELVATFAATQVRLADAWTRLAREKAAR